MTTPVEIAVRASGTAAASRALGQVEARTRSVGSTMKRAFVGGAAAVGLVGLTRGIAGFAASSVQAEAKFSQSMRLIGASTGAPASEIKKLNDLAIDLGAKTSFSAQDAADAMLELAKAGVDTKTIYKGGVAGTLQLAAAGGLELGTAATIASNALNTFNLGGGQMKRVAAALAGGANASTASVESLGQALQQVGPGATNAGLSLQETVAALAAFDSAGIKGSDAGTSLKTMLARLVPQTDKAQTAMEGLGLSFVKRNGDFRSLTQISGQLQAKLGGLSRAERVRALSTIFGSDATRAATVLMKEGAGGIRGYIKATNDQGAAAKMANARMGGTAGVLERVSGAVETAKLRLGQELAPLIQRAGTAFADNLVPAFNAGIKAGKAFADAVAPAVSAVVDLLGDLVPSGEHAGSMFNDVFLPAVKAVSDVLAFAVRAIDALPAPLLSMGVEAAAAALILPRLSGTVTAMTGTVTTNIARLQQWRAEMTYTETRAGAVATATGKLGAAAKAAAGVGGMLALAHGAQQSNRTLGVLEQAAGGAALGFSVGGPWGAAIGAGAGAMVGLATHTGQAVQSLKQMKSAAEGGRGAQLNLRDSLDQTTGAMTRQARQSVSQDVFNQGLSKSLNTLGVSNRDLVSAVLGQEGAYKRVNAAVQKFRNVGGAAATTQQNALSDAAVNIGAYLGGANAKFRQTRSEIQKVNAGTEGWGKALHGLPKEARVRLRNLDYKITTGQIGKLARQIKTNPKELTTKLKLAGVNVVTKGARDTKKSLEDVGKTKANTKPYEVSVKAGAAAAERIARHGGQAIAAALKSETGKARPNTTPFRSILNSQLAGMRGVASSGGSGIGSSLSSGFENGLDFGGMANAVASAINGAIAAGRRAADSHSPSRKTQKIGRDMGRGLEKGLDDSRRTTRKHAKSLVDQAIRASAKGAGDLRDLLGRLFTSRKLKGDALKRAHRAVEDESKALNKNAAAQDRVNRSLTNARAHYKDLVQQAKDYATSIREGIIATGDVTQLGKNEDGTATTTGILDQLRGKLRDAKRFADLIQQLTKAGINATTLQQLLAAGVEGGLSTAEAIVAGGSSAITEINSLTAELTRAGAGLGTSTAETLYGAGIKAAQGLIDGLEDRAKALDKIADRLAARLVRAIRKALKIHSPSEVMRDLGKLTAEGLTIGLDDVHVTRAGSRLASDLVRGFGDPKLTARAAFEEAATGTTPAFSFDLRLTAEQATALQQGRSVTISADAFQAAGGRRVAKVTGR